MNITVNNLSLAYDGHTLFQGVSFAVNSGQRVCIDGPSGCGKSSLLRAILGFVQPQQGGIVINDQSVDEKSVWDIRRNIAYITQEPDLGRQIVMDRICRPFWYKANSHLEFSDDALNDWLDRFKLDQKMLSKQTADLSGGQKQRIAIIIGLLLQRPILLLDEPTSALDKESKQILKDILSELDNTILFVSHEDVLVELADSTVNLAAGGAHE